VPAQLGESALDVARFERHDPDALPHLPVGFIVHGPFRKNREVLLFFSGQARPSSIRRQVPNGAAEPQRVAALTNDNTATKHGVEKADQSGASGARPFPRFSRREEEVPTL